MKKVICSVYDKRAEFFDRPFTAQSNGEMIRAFTDIAVNADHPIGQHPEDYSLYRIGYFDDVSGLITPEDPILLINGLEAVQQSRAAFEMRNKPAEENH